MFSKWSGFKYGDCRSLVDYRRSRNYFLVMPDMAACTLLTVCVLIVTCTFIWLYQWKHTCSVHSDQSVFILRQTHGLAWIIPRPGLAKRNNEKWFLSIISHVSPTVLKHYLIGSQLIHACQSMVIFLTAFLAQFQKAGVTKYKNLNCNVSLTHPEPSRTGFQGQANQFTQKFLFPVLEIWCDNARKAGSAPKL